MKWDKERGRKKGSEKRGPRGREVRLPINILGPFGYPSNEDRQAAVHVCGVHQVTGHFGPETVRI